MNADAIIVLTAAILTAAALLGLAAMAASAVVRGLWPREPERDEDWTHWT